jgi:hypothetical protein
VYIGFGPEKGHMATFFSPQTQLAQTGHTSFCLFPSGSETNKLYIINCQSPTHFDHEDGGSPYFQDVGSTALINAVHRVRSRIKIKNGSL